MIRLRVNTLARVTVFTDHYLFSFLVHYTNVQLFVIVEITNNMH
jgi:hypothetical protein